MEAREILNEEKAKLDKLLSQGNLDFIADNELLWKAGIKLIIDNKEPASLDSRFGGAANLPDETEWPRRDNGRPLALLAQLNLRDVPSDMPGYLGPREGLLLFFYDAWLMMEVVESGENSPWTDDGMTFGPENQDAWQVIYVPDTNLAKPRNYPEDLYESAKMPAKKLIFQPMWTLVDWDSPRFEELDLSEEEIENLWEVLDILRYSDEEDQVPPHLFLGHAASIQGPPDIEAGIDTKNDGWELLLQIESDEEMHWMWGDVGSLYYMIQPDHLREHQFDQVYGVFQCH
jgi:uncharacterized protein YwqG